MPAVARFRDGAAPLVALCACGLALTCLPGVGVLTAQLPRLSQVDSRYVGWVGLGMVVVVAAAAAVLVSVDRVGTGPALAVGAAAAAFGLGLAGDVSGQGRLVAALLVCALAVGALLAAGLCVALEVGGPWRAAAVTCWLAPLAMWWPLRSWWVSGAGTPMDELRVSLHVPVAAVAAAVAVLALWAVVTLLTGPPFPPGQWSRGRRRAHLDVGAVLAGCGAAVAVLGCLPMLGARWLHPLVLVAAAAAVFGLGVTAHHLGRWRGPAVVVLTVAVSGPSAIRLALSAAPDRLPAWALGVLLALAVGGVVVGRWLGRRGLLPAVMLPAVLLLAVGAAASWVLPGAAWQVLAAAAPLVFACAVLLAGCIGTAIAASGDSVPVRSLSWLVIGGVVVGLCGAVAVCWALTGALPVDTPGAAAARTWLGLTFAGAVAASAYVYVCGADTGPAESDTGPAESDTGSAESAPVWPQTDRMTGNRGPTQVSPADVGIPRQV